MSILVIDFETTGLVKEGVTDFLAQPGICQIGAVILDRGIGPNVGGSHTVGEWNFDGQLESFINPEIAQWEAGAIKVHGLSPEKVRDEPTFFEFFPKLAAFAKGCSHWAGYNTKFDRDVLWFQLLRYGFERNFPWPPGEIDVMQLAARRLNIQGKRGQKWPKLVDAYTEVFGKSYEGAHDALADVRATGELLAKWL